MRYFKVINNGYISQIGIGVGGEEISKVEYDAILLASNNMPHAQGFAYRLREDLTWEQYKLPIVEEAEEELTDQEAYNIIMGVSE